MEGVKLYPIKPLSHLILLCFFASRLPVYQDFSEHEKLVLGGFHAS
jgi:hypothetical protein